MTQVSPTKSLPNSTATDVPVFVFCMGRSGSTLLRFLLDAHPDLACPPETSLPALCGQLAVVWSLIEGAPLSLNRGDTPPQVPDAAIAGIRHMVDMMTGSYLVRRGKSRFCDKSLGSARFVDLLVRVYPEAKFICLYRHPMDMIRSGIDACPWGLNGYGFDQYIGSSPGNAVFALARYWLENATLIVAAENQYPDRCHRVRYEDLVSNPEKMAEEIYAFIGVSAIPGISMTCFSADRERFGPADYKIWATSGITTNSVGKGESIPAGLIPPPMVSSINDLANQLGYRSIDEDWGTPGKPLDPRLPETMPAGATTESVGLEDLDLETRILDQRLRVGMDKVGSLALSRLDASAVGKFLVVSRGMGGSEARWLVDLDAQVVTSADVDPDDTVWNVLGSPETWNAVLSGHTNLHMALRRYDLRYCSTDEDDTVVTETRLRLLADLLGLSTWLSVGALGQEPATSISAAES